MNKEGGHMGVFTLTKTQLNIMQILWDATEPLTIADISAILEISTTSLSNMVNQLIKKGFIEISGVKRTDNHYSRTLKALLEKEEYAAKMVSSLNMKKGSFSAVVSALVDEYSLNDGYEEIISELEEVLNKYTNKEEISEK